MGRHLRRAARLLAVAGVALLGMTAVARPAAAHERREVGDIAMIVGFAEEPAFAGFENGVQLVLERAADESPIEGAAEALSVEVRFGEVSRELPLEPAFGSPGEYLAHFIPTRPGTYEFRVTGTVEGQDVDESFTSGPDTFSDVQDSSTVAFPVSDPSTAEVAERLERETARLRERIDALAGAEDRASTARTLALAGLALGAVGVALGAVAVRRPRAAPTEAAQPRPGKGQVT